jgi:SAM-dependent methyltransferase
MNEMSTDVEWEKWGARDPYFGVITCERFRNRNLTNEAKVEFFESGRNHINQVLETCRHHLDQNFSPKRALDFGCGVGRLVLPLAELAEYVMGVDVSRSMLAEAEKNCKEQSLKNVSLLKSDDTLSLLEGHYFDFIHSFIVFQHLNTTRGMRIFEKLLEHLEDGGICAIQFTYSKALFRKSYGPAFLKLRDSWRKLKRLGKKVLLPFGVPSEDPEMQLNPYNLNKLLLLLQTAGIRNSYMEFTDHGGELGIFLYFQKPKD